MSRNFQGWEQWLTRRQMKALESAYDGAMAIKVLEDRYFNGNRIAYAPEQSKTFTDYVRSLRDRQLLRIRFDLAQLKISGFLLNHPTPEPSDRPPDETSSSHPELESQILTKLNFIDSIIDKYRDESDEELALLQTNPNLAVPTLSGSETNLSSAEAVNDPAIAEAQTKTPKPRSLFRSWTLNKKFSPDYEQQVVQEIRLQRKQSKIAARWLIILILVPLLTQIIARNFIFEPLLEGYGEHHKTEIQFSDEIKESFRRNFAAFKEEMEIREILKKTLGIGEETTEEEKQKKIAERTAELWQESIEEAFNGLKNVLADIVALITFIGLVVFNRQKLTHLRSFSNRTFLGLSDPTKVFLFILLTDMFVGFHSAEGWDVILKGFSSHWGLPENENFIGLFIATIPVIMDSAIKFWIFNYLTRYSPSASAILERMNT
jgi:hypothetical protein